MSDFDFGTRTPDDVDRELRSRGLEPSEQLTRRRVDPRHIGRLEGYHLPPDPDRVDEIVREHGTNIAPILLVERDGEYEAVDGLHRIGAATRLGMSGIDSIVMSESAFDALFRDYGELAMARWAHDMAGTGYAP